MKDLGMVDAYAFAVSKGYTGTREEFAELMASYATVAEQAAESAAEAAASASTATTAKTDAISAKDTAVSASATATQAAQTATTKASEAAASASSASTDAATASTAATTATQAAATATTAATTATEKTSEASASASAAATSEANAKAAAQDATESAETLSGSVAQIATNTQDITQLKEDLNDITEPVFNWTAITVSSPNVTILDGFVRSPDQTYPGRIDASTTKKCYYFRVTEDSYVFDVAGGSWSVVRISETEPTIGSDDEIAVYYSGTHNVNNPLFVAAGNYVTITSNTGTPRDTTYVSPDAVALKQTVGLTDAMADEIITQKSLADYGRWTNGYWNSATTTRNDAYRAKCSHDIVFEKDTVLISYDALYIRGYIDAVSIDRKSAVYVPANAVCHFFISRLIENTSETINPVDFASAVKIVNEWPYDKYNLLHDSFYGLGMFRKIGVCGDSYSAVRLGYSWGQVVAGELGVNVLNFAKSGDNSAMWIADTEHGLPLVLSSEKCDLYWLALGINDSDTIVSNPSYLGSAADLSGGDYTQYPNTFWGNQGRIIESIKAYAPKAKIVMFKPIFGKVSTALAPTNVTNLPAIRNAIGEIATYYNIPVIDSLDDIFYRSPEYASHMDSDISAGNHPSVMLYPGIAHANMRLFSNCVSKYDSYFMGIDYSS